MDHFQPPLNIIVSQDDPSAVTTEGAAGCLEWESGSFDEPRRPRRAREHFVRQSVGGNQSSRWRSTPTADSTEDGLDLLFPPASEATEEREIIYESKTTRVFRVVETISDRKASGELPPRAVAIKTLVDTSQSSNGANAELLNEYSILKEYLASCPSARAAIAHRPLGGAAFALYLRWVDGQTLREWTRANPVPLRSTTNDDNATQRWAVTPVWVARGLPLYVNAMQVVAGALADVHEAGVGHGNVSLDNIIMLEDTSTYQDHSCSLPEQDEGGCNNVSNELSEGRDHDHPLKAVLIDFGRSFSMKNDNKGTSDDALLMVKDPRIIRDLRMLGLMFVEMFYGETKGREKSSLSYDGSSTSIHSTTSGDIRYDANSVIESYRKLVPESVLEIMYGLMGSLESFHSNESSGTGQCRTAREVEQQLKDIACRLTESAKKMKHETFFKVSLPF